MKYSALTDRTIAAGSPSMQRVWIEILHNEGIPLIFPVTLHAEGVD